MEQKAVFNYDGQTGVYLGATMADESPLEPGIFLIPRNATDIAPPDEVPAGSAAFFRGVEWSVEIVPAKDENLDGEQDAPQGFAAEEGRPGYFKRLLLAVVGR